MQFLIQYIQDSQSTFDIAVVKNIKSAIHKAQIIFD